MRIRHRVIWGTLFLLAWCTCHGSAAGEYLKKATWRETLAASLGSQPKQAIASATTDFPDNRIELETVADWLLQDEAADRPLGIEAVRRVVEGLGPDAAKLRADCDGLAASKVPSGDPRWAELYLSACEARRAARLAQYRDRLQRVVFTKHYDLGGSHYAYTEGQSDAQNERHFRPGSSLCILEMHGLWGRVRALLDDPHGVIRDPDVSYDGQRILFAWKKSLDQDDYHLYELAAKDGSIRTITSGLGFADYEGAYLPTGDLVFNSTRCVQTVDCWWTEVSNLYTCDADGRFLRQLCFDQVHDNFPTVTQDGRVIYTRWDYNDRGQIYPQGLFQMNPDGTSQTELYGNNSWFPTTIAHARSIPGTSKIVCIFTGHHSAQKGWMGILDPRKGRQENQGAQLIAPRRDTPAVHVDGYGQSGDQFQYPYPLDETMFLVTFRRTDAPHFAIYLMTIDGQRELLASDPTISCNQPVPLSPRPVPAIRPSLVDYRKTSGTIYLQDIYAGPGLAGIPRGTIKQLRVIALEFRAAGVGQNGNQGPAGGAMASTPISIEGAWDVKKVLGAATVHEDGSACFVAPARTPLYFQAIDEKGHMVQSMRSWMSLQPGEAVACVGCHEHKNSTPQTGRFTRAMAAGPQPLKAFDGASQGFSFIQEVQPILDKHCVGCHHVDQPPDYAVRPRARGRARGERAVATSPAPSQDSSLAATAPVAVADGSPSPQVKPAFSLKGTQTLDRPSERKWSDAYRALAHRSIANWINIQSAPPMLPPYHAGASQSRLLALLEDGQHYGVVLSQGERERLAMWIDLLVPYCGDYTEAMNEELIPRYNHFLDKRRRWQAQESHNIAEFLRVQSP